MSRRPPGPALLACLLALAAPACGTDDGVAESRIIGDTLTVYSSLPLDGPAAPIARDMVAAEKLALSEAGGTAGAFAVSYVSLDASPRGAVAANARRAVETPNTVAYLGELEPGASTTSAPILDAGGILQVSPRDTYPGLTEPAGEGEPARWYPSGSPNFTRVVPPADVAALLRAAGVRRVAVVGEERPGRLEGVRVVGAGEDPDALLLTGAIDAAAARAAGDAGAELPLYATDRVALDPGAARRLGDAARRLVVLGVDPGEDARFARRFAGEYGRVPHPQAVLGYRAMRLVLDAIRAAGPDADSRREVVRRALERARTPRATLARTRVRGNRLVRVGPPL